MLLWHWMQHVFFFQTFNVSELFFLKEKTKKKENENVLWISDWHHCWFDLHLKKCPIMKSWVALKVLGSYSLCPYFSQSVSGICGFLVMAQMKSDRSRKLVPQRLTNRWTMENFVSVGQFMSGYSRYCSINMVVAVRMQKKLTIFIDINLLTLLTWLILLWSCSGPNCLHLFLFQRMALIRKTTKK